MTTPSVQLPLERGRGHWAAPLRANWWVLPALLVLVLLAPWVEGGKPLLGIPAVDPFWTGILIVMGINLTMAVSLQLINGIAGQFSLGHAGFMAVGAYMGGYAVATYGTKTTPQDDLLEWAHPGGVLLYCLVVLLMTTVVGGLLLGVYRGVLALGKLHRRIPTAVGLLLLLWVVADLALTGGPNPAAGAANPLGAVRGLGLLVTSITGTYDWLMTSGTGVADAVTALVPGAFRRGACLVVSILGGGIMAAVVGLVVGLPTLRLRGDYLAIATLGVAELIRTTITNSEPLGRATGLQAPTFAVEADAESKLAAVYFFPWVYGVALLTILVVWRLQHSPKGRALQCLSEDEIASSAVGIDVTQHKVLAFILGAALAGMGGALFAHYIGYINPKQFDLTKSIEYVVMVTLGGLGSVPGTIVAAVLLSLFQPALQTAGQWAPAWAAGPAEAANKYRLVIYALLLVVAMLLRSRGLPLRHALSLLKRRTP